MNQIIYIIKEGSRVTYHRKAGTVVALGFHGMCCFNADDNKRGNDGMQLVAIADVKPIIPNLPEGEK